MKKLTLVFPFGDLELMAEAGETVFEVLRREGLPIRGTCSGRGMCGKCLVRCLTDSFAPPRETEKKKLGNLLDQGYRLACMLKLEEDASIELVPESQKAKIKTQSIDEMLQTDGESGYAAAFDMGTTTVVGFLIELTTGKTIAHASELNRQRPFGADVTTRCSYALENEGGLQHLQTCILEQLDTMIEQMIDDAQIQKVDVIRVALAGNAVMMHMAAGLPVDQLAVLPYEPAYRDAFEKPAQALRMQSVPEHTPICFMPLVSGYVGADTVAASLSIQQDMRKDIVLLVDIGTNGEMVVGNRDALFCCAAAAGPAFEGGRIQCGMAGIEGAIEKVYDDKGIQSQTIGGVPAEGICGSGLIDAVALLLKKGCIDETGRLSDVCGIDEKYDRRFLADGSFCILSVAEGANRDVVLTQQDIREIQLAKSAIAAGIEVLLQHAGKGLTDIDCVLLAGGFGSYMDHMNACSMGLLPMEALDRIVEIGNAAGKGVREYAASAACREHAGQLARKMQYIELAQEKQFSDQFMVHMSFDQAID